MDCAAYQKECLRACDNMVDDDSVVLTGVAGDDILCCSFL